MRFVRIGTLALFAVVATGCEQAPTSESVSDDYRACLERHGVVADDERVTLRADGSIESIEAQILSEADVAYEPAVRLACTEEIEGS